MSPTFVYPCTPATGSPPRLTGYAEPAKSAVRMLRNSSPPIEPRRDEAPITATDAGSKKPLREAVTATWFRAAT